MCIACLGDILRIAQYTECLERLQCSPVRYFGPFGASSRAIEVDRAGLAAMILG